MKDVPPVDAPTLPDHGQALVDTPSAEPAAAGGLTSEVELLLADFNAARPPSTPGRDLMSLHRRFAAARGDNFLLREQMAALHQQLAAVGQEFATVRQELAAVRQELAAVRQELAGARQEVAAVRQEFAGTGQDVILVRQEFAGCRHEFAAVRHELAVCRHQVAVLEWDRNTHQRHALELREHLGTVDRELHAIRASRSFRLADALRRFAGGVRKWLRKLRPGRRQ